MQHRHQPAQAAGPAGREECADDLALRDDILAVVDGAEHAIGDGGQPRPGRLETRRQRRLGGHGTTPVGQRADPVAAEPRTTRCAG
ncbi:hypothetical protein [Mycobacterium servetii]|uniref:Uncharacterized protein n=1 Tax=Mycobacterium servetii TaxID=3237418 RepID=A0ABV4C0I3_9MYCO